MALVPTPRRLWDLLVIALAVYLLLKTLTITYTRARTHAWYRWVLLAIGAFFLLSLLA